LLQTLQQFERFRVAAPLEEVAELWVDFGGQRLLEPVDFFGDFAEAHGVMLRIAAAVFVADDGEAFAKGGREFS
jgi:hypothetical protein